MGRIVGFCTALALLTSGGVASANAAQPGEADGTSPSPIDPTWIEDATSALMQELSLLHSLGALPPDTTVAFIADWAASDLSGATQQGLADLEVANSALLLEAEAGQWSLSAELRVALAPSGAELRQRLADGEQAFLDPRLWLDALTDLLVREGAAPAGERNRAEYGFIVDSLQDFDATGVVDLEVFVGATAPIAPATPATEPVGAPALVSPANAGTRFPTLAIIAGVFIVVLAMAAGLFGRSRRATSSSTGDIDELTQLRTRRRMDTDLSRLVTGEQIGFAMIDVDRFKAYNADHGQPQGDRALAQIAATISENVRSADVVYRYGGGAFSVLFRDCDQVEATEVIERVRAAVEVLPLDGPTRITVSTGIAIGDAADVLVLSEQAGAALYGAKTSGRNTTVVHGE